MQFVSSTLDNDTFYKLNEALKDHNPNSHNHNMGGSDETEVKQKENDRVVDKDYTNLERPESLADLRGRAIMVCHLKAHPRSLLPIRSTLTDLFS